MPVERTLAIHGLDSRVRLVLRGSRAAELHDALRRSWSRCLEPVGLAIEAGDIPVELRSAGEPSMLADRGVSGEDLLAVMQETTQTVTRAFIAAQAGRLLMLHAGACADPVTGSTVAFVAPGGTGKTTLAEVFASEWGYLTDETVGIRPDGTVAPYPKPLSKRPSKGAGPKAEVSPDHLGLRPAPAEARLRRIVLLRRDPTRDDPPAFTPLDIPDAIVALAPETSSLSKLPRPLHLLADLLAQIGPVLRCDYREAAGLVPLMQDLLAREADGPVALIDEALVMRDDQDGESLGGLPDIVDQR
ncbi:MAG: hypothetical protein R2722_00570 [Tessaracoccus sp.]